MGHVLTTLVKKPTYRENNVDALILPEMAREEFLRKTTLTHFTSRTVSSIDELRTRWVMISNAIYTQIEPNRVGPYSSIIMKSMLRHDLGFTGIVISDDMCNAKQLAAWSYASRARAFFNAGGTMMLCVDAAAIPTIHKSMVALAKSSPSFRARIDAAALEVLQTRAGQ